jgi:molybdenum cofactor guanylyltransferase
MNPSGSNFLAGIFVGGAARRMGGVPKGLLRAPDGDRIVDRWARMLDALAVPWVLVGRSPAYGSVAARVLDDDPPGMGPLGGLCALLDAAGDRWALALACDMPRVGAPLLRRLIEQASEAAALAPRIDGRWQPLFARYHAPRALGVARRHLVGSRSLQGVLDELGADELTLSPAERAEQADWDSPGDIASEKTEERS